MGVQLIDQEKNDLREGKKVYIEGMTAKSGNELSLIHISQRKLRMTPCKNVLTV